MVATSAKVARCLEKAAQARAKASKAISPMDRQFWQALEAKWMCLARNYGFIDRVSDFTAASKRFTAAAAGKRRRLLTN